LRRPYASNEGARHRVDTLSRRDPGSNGTAIAEEVLMKTVTSAVVALGLLSGCAGTTQIEVPRAKPSAKQMAEFWIDPGPKPRDLFNGIGGRGLAPQKDAEFKLQKKDELGYSVSYDVVGPDGTEWSAKIGAEAQTEVVVSRLLWGLGYHQPPVYYLPSWTLVEEARDVKKESEARFRPKLDFLDRKKKFWHWSDNPFLGTRPFNGLLVILLTLNSTDLKDDNNSIYELTKRFPADGPDVRRWFLVRDLGAALGQTGKLFPRRNWLEGFEKEPFINGVKDGRIQFAYTGRHREILEIVTADDVRWAAERMQRLTDGQWRDAFRCANYTDAEIDRYVKKISEKIQEAMKAAAAAQAASRTDRSHAS
jgi:hypothetical protein